MSKSYSFIGTSYLHSCEDQYHNSNNLRFEFQTNLIQAVSEKHPSNIIYNCSEGGHGITTYFKRLLTLLDRYDPDVFVFEIPNAQRILAHTDNEYGENYDIHFPVQIWHAGKPQNLDEKFRTVSASIIDDSQVLMEPNELNQYWTEHTNMPFHLGSKQWQGYVKVLSTFNDGEKSRFLDTIAQCEVINDFLVSKGKEVFWFSWKPNGLKIDSDKLTLFKPHSISEWKYEQDIGKVTNPEVARQHLKQFCYDDNHLHSKYMPKFAEYFDKIFK